MPPAVLLVAVLLALLTACSSTADAPAAARPERTVARPPAASAPGGSGTAAPARARPQVLVGLGDSITQAFLACGGPSDCPRASWAAGDDPRVGSHAQRLRRSGSRVQGRTLAVSGARVEDLPRQARAAVAERADLVAVLIGVNDACRGRVEQMTPVAVFARRAEEALTVLARGRPQARVLVLSLPDVGRLHRLGRSRPEVRATWERYGICPVLLRDATDDRPAARARRAVAQQRLAAYDGALAAACRRHPRCTWDGGAVARHPFPLSAVSAVDHFHPSLEGQRALAAVSWAVAPWRR